MKHLKKMMALVIAMVMVLSMSISVFAEGEAVTVQITNGEYDSDYYEKGADEINYSAHTYKAAQILAATAYDSETGEYSGLSWGEDVSDPAALLAALKADDTWGDVFEDYVTDAADVTNDNPQFTAASFAKAISSATADQAKALAQVLKSLYANTGTEISGTNAVTLPGIGYYLIDDVTTDLDDDAANPVILFAGPGSNKVRIKVDKPSQDKEVKENVKAEWNEVADYNIGDAVPFKITSKVPNVENFENYTMKFTDTMSDGLTLYEQWTGEEPSNIEAAGLKITIGDDITNDAAVTYTPADHGFEIELTVKDEGELADWAVSGTEITIEFYGVLNEDAEIGLPGNTNTSKLEYSNNPDDDESSTETPDDTVIVFTYELDVNKIDGATEYALPGAQFALQAASGEHNGKWAVLNEDGYIVKWQDNAPEEDAAADADGLNALLTSDDEGNFKIVGLDDGTYTLREIKAPAGYNTIEDITLVVTGTTVHGEDYTDALEHTPANALTDLTLTVDDEEPTSGDTSTGIVSTIVENNSGATLPETGGVGTTIFYIIGAILVIGAGIILVTRRRMSAN